MPIPSPKKGESNEDFTDRCHRSLAKEFPDKKQRHRVCQDSWRKGPKGEGMDYSHIIEYLNSGHWAITPEALENMHQIMAIRLHTGQLTEEEIKEKIGDQSDKRPNAPYNVNGTAVIPIVGPISKKANLFTRISGGASAELLQRDLQIAMEDDEVDAVLFDIDSPGGSVDGPFGLADAILEYRGNKPMVAFSDGQMTSAAYLIGSAADKVMASKTARTGSIGVITAHYDYSKMQEMQGVKKTYLYAGKYKAMGHESAPLDDKAKEYIQNRLDHYYTLFVDAVVEHRGADKDAVLSDMADGRIFVGKQALGRGLIDEIGMFDGALRLVKSIEVPKTKTKNVKEVKSMDPKEYKAEHPKGFNSIVEEAQEEVRQDFVDAIKEKNEEIRVLKEQNEELQTDLTSTNDRLLALEKKDALRDEQEMSRTADRIWDDALTASDVPQRLHPKVRVMVSHNKFVADGKFDEAGFRTAIDAEIKDWEGLHSTDSSIIGGGTPPGSPPDAKEEDAIEKEDDKAVDEMLQLAEETSTVGNA